MTIPNLDNLTESELFELGNRVHELCTAIINARAAAKERHFWNGDEQLEKDFRAALNPRKKRAERMNEERMKNGK